MMTTVIMTMMEVMMLIMGTNRTQTWVVVGRSSHDDNQDADGDIYIMMHCLFVCHEK